MRSGPPPGAGHVVQLSALLRLEREDPVHHADAAAVLVQHAPERGLFLHEVVDDRPVALELEAQLPDRLARGVARLRAAELLHLPAQPLDLLGLQLGALLVGLDRPLRADPAPERGGAEQERDAQQDQQDPEAPRGVTREVVTQRDRRGEQPARVADLAGVAQHLGDRLQRPALAGVDPEPHAGAAAPDLDRVAALEDDLRDLLVVDEDPALQRPEVERAAVRHVVQRRVARLDREAFRVADVGLGRAAEEPLLLRVGDRLAAQAAGQVEQLGAHGPQIITVSY
jgi:hypothetical protein